jgi:hypothetical protein
MLELRQIFLADDGGTLFLDYIEDRSVCMLSCLHICVAIIFIQCVSLQREKNNPPHVTT